MNNVEEEIEYKPIWYLLGLGLILILSGTTLLTYQLATNSLYDKAVYIASGMFIVMGVILCLFGLGLNYQSDADGGYPF